MATQGERWARRAPYIAPHKWPSPLPSPGGRGLRRAQSSGDMSSARREAAALIPSPWRGMLFPLPPGEGQGEGPDKATTRWSFVSCKGQEQEQE